MAISGFWDQNCYHRLPCSFQWCSVVLSLSLIVELNLFCTNLQVNLTAVSYLNNIQYYEITHRFFFCEFSFSIFSTDTCFFTVSTFGSVFNTSKFEGVFLIGSLPSLSFSASNLSRGSARLGFFSGGLTSDLSSGWSSGRCTGISSPICEDNLMPRPSTVVVVQCLPTQINEFCRIVASFIKC
jgi:hypothetical protein